VAAAAAVGGHSVAQYIRPVMDFRFLSYTCAPRDNLLN
jgi:hypothetical protein